MVINVDNKSINNKNIDNNIDYSSFNSGNVATEMEGNSTIYHGNEVYSTSNNDRKNIRAFIFEGMDNSEKSLDVMINIQKYCSGPMFVWDHSRITIHKATYANGKKANFRVEFLRLNVAALRRFAKILKMSGTISICYEDIPQKKNVIA